jgi:threonine synthase
MAHVWRGVIEEYRDWLPVMADAPVVSLGEGGTPLVHSAWLSGLVRGEVWLKIEGNNPTGSFKDRGMTTAVSVAVGEGAKAVVCASTGNTSASMTAYAAKAGLTPVVLVPHGKIAAGKMAQAVMHGAEVIQVKGGFDECLQLSRALADKYPVALVNSVNPVRLQGQKTASFEIVDTLGDAPDLHVLPVGNAGNISAVATAIRIGNPASWHLAEAARDESAGRIGSVSDEQILQAQRDLASRDGVFVEPASAAGVAGLVEAAAAGQVEPGQRITVTVTGHGLKDIDTALSGAGALVDAIIEFDVDAAAEAAGLL